MYNASDVAQCEECGREYTVGDSNADISTAFCSARCEARYDAGADGYANDVSDIEAAQRGESR